MEPQELQVAQARGVAEVIHQRRQEILVRWADLLRRKPKARPLTEEQLLDHLPRVLTRLSAALEQTGHGESALDAQDAREHALHRLDEGFDLPELTEEYGILRRVLFSVLREHAPQLVIEGFDVVDAAIDRRLAESVDQYVQVRYRTLQALDRVVEPVSEPGAVDEPVRSLLAVLMQTVPSIDAVTWLVRQGDRLRVRQALGVTAERDPGFSLGIGEGFAGTIAATRRPLMLSSAATDPLVRSDFLRQRGVAAMYGVPIRRGGEVLGVVHMSSLTARDFAEEDKLVLRVVAQRVAGLLRHAELVETEKELRAKAEAALAEARQAQRFLETVIGSIDEGVLVASGDRSIVLASEGAARIFGLSRSALLSIPLDAFPERFRPRTGGQPQRPALFDALRGQRLPASERIITDAHGHDRTLIISAAPVTGDGQRAGAVVVFVDITERKRLEDELRRNVALRDRLMSIVSHDLRSPLTAIATSGHLLATRDGAPPWVLAAASRIQRIVYRMARMISDLLDLARIEATGAVPVSPAPIDLCEVVRETVEEIELSHPGRLNLRLSRHPVPGLWDGERLAQVVANLVNNALEHGSPDGQVSVSVEERDGSAELQVRNAGTIPPELMATLFDPFRQARAGPRGSRGLGLGLHIVREIVRAHRGEVRVSSDQEEGTVFTVRLPESGAADVDG